MLNLGQRALEKTISQLLEEDDLSRNFTYMNSLPDDLVTGEIHIKSDVTLAGLPFFVEVFRYLGADFETSDLVKEEGKTFSRGSVLSPSSFKLPFGVALTGERLALNLFQRATSIATTTRAYVEKAEKYGIRILDTRKTTPGLRALEKYATRVGGAYNHRLGQTDAWMVKDNHKTFFGGLKGAVEFFRSQGGFYTPLIVEIHDLKEISEASDLGVKHFLLDNFSPDEIVKAVDFKSEKMTYEVSGGVRLPNLESYLIEGVDAISVGGLTNAPEIVDISFKYGRVKE